MSWFTPKLEPGERLAWRSPKVESWPYWLYVVGAIAAAAAVVFVVILWLGSPEFAVVAVGNAVSTGIMALAIILVHHHWRVALTDRRILVWQGYFRRAPREIPLREIEEIRMNIAAGYGIARTADQEIMLPMDQADLPELKQAVEHAKGGAAP